MRQEPPLFMHQNRVYWGKILPSLRIEFDLNSTPTTIEVIIFIKIDTSSYIGNGNKGSDRMV